MTARPWLEDVRRAWEEGLCSHLDQLSPQAWLRFWEQDIWAYVPPISVSAHAWATMPPAEREECLAWLQARNLGFTIPSGQRHCPEVEVLLLVQRPSATSWAQERSTAALAHLPTIPSYRSSRFAWVEDHLPVPGLGHVTTQWIAQTWTGWFLSHPIPLGTVYGPLPAGCREIVWVSQRPALHGPEPLLEKRVATLPSACFGQMDGPFVHQLCQALSCDISLFTAWHHQRGMAIRYDGLGDRYHLMMDLGRWLTAGGLAPAVPPEAVHPTVVMPTEPFPPEITELLYRPWELVAGAEE